ncbi:helix-turn-helix domain-containing protein [Rhodoplanes sp. TEM]|uniref:Helix-turn-helix domain-containing protein n=1 Tax=Rhodoplanes tepidamans TaxID=200616 RepID=A0ABT5JEQ5_RHOTP|nr:MULTISPECIES: helix-turn-helix domain-containing protein [Rhodoplanes]MDC7788017.1 helix-turn-helix domain-containing protein [Rhodoplanes tepidamans]MDC7984857.1 helix-turn-helix domain-containing protein [Rhodoplanes sp. TEM]MDQ0358446.1 Ner family transcriptional regulator [Rhodoplanes tepidamans]
MTNTGWHRADIVAAVRKKGSNLAQLSLRHGYCVSALRTSLGYPRTPSNRIIADFIGVPLHELWPQWFDAAGELIGPKTRRRRRRPRGEGHTNPPGKSSRKRGRA